jgi:hypothetical protein
MKKISFILAFSTISVLAFAQQPDKTQDQKSLDKNELTKSQKPVQATALPKIERLEVLDQNGNKPYPTTFYIINDKPVSKEEYLLHLRSNNETIVPESDK